MMCRQLGFLSFFLVLSLTMLGQVVPEPCGPEGSMAPFCEQACIICDIDGFEGRNDGESSTLAPDVFCSQGDQKVTWIAFIAGTPNLEMEIEVSNCSVNDGLQVGVFETEDCINFTQAMTCVNPIGGFGVNPGMFTNAPYGPLTVGQHYFLLMDGNNGDECDYVVTVLSGSTNVQQLVPTNPIEVPELMCANQPFALSFLPQAGAASQEWRVDGLLAGVGDQVLLTLPDGGTYNVCIDESNACDDPEPYCVDIEVMPQIEEERNFVICEGDTIEYKGVEYWIPGTYPNILVPAEEGCDSVINLNLEFGAVFEGSDFYNICDGDTLFLDGQEHFEPGIYDHFLLTEKGCDSVVHVNVFLVICNMVGSADPEHLLCYGDGATGSFTFRIEEGTPPFEYEYAKVLDASINGSGMIMTDNENITIDNLPAGSYQITVQDTFGNFTIINTEILEPSPLSSQHILSDYNGYNISCASGSDGIITTTIEGGTPGYQYMWDGGSVSNVANQLSVGDHFITVIDNNNCVFLDTITLTAPLEINSIVELVDPNCDGPNTGEINVLNISGGVAEYNVSFDEGGFGNTTEYNSLNEATYTLVIQDANGCLDTNYYSLVAAEIPEITVEDLTINLGDSINVEPGLNTITVGDVQWTSEELLDCYDCIDPYAFPLFTNQYNVAVTSADGCTREENFTIYVEKDRGIYKPNIFNPTSTDANQYFMLTGGNQIKHLNNLYIFDRWGNQVFQGEQLNHKIASEGWDGTFNGRDAMVGVYFWTAEIEFLDGVTEFFNGDLTLVR